MDSREHDYNLIQQGLKSKNPVDRKQAKMAEQRIKSESKEVRKLREELLTAHRSGNKGRVEELHHKLWIPNKRIKERVEKYYGKRHDI